MRLQTKIKRFLSRKSEVGRGVLWAWGSALSGRGGRPFSRRAPPGRKIYAFTEVFVM